MFTEADADAARKQWRNVADQICPRVPKLAALMDTAEEDVDILPVQLRVRVTRRPRYACRACEGAVVMAEAPPRPIDGGLPTEALIVHVVVSKFSDSLPLYRQSQMLARQGIKSLDVEPMGRRRLLVADAAL